MQLFFIHSCILHDIQLRINCKKKVAQIFGNLNLKFLDLKQWFQRVGNPTIIQSDIKKLKNFVKFCQGKISNSRNVKFLKIAAGSAHVCLMVKEIDGQTEEHTDKWVGIVILTCTKNDYQMQRSV